MTLPPSPPLPRATPGADAPAWLRVATSSWVAMLVLAAFWVGLVASVATKSMTADEIVHATGGYTYWKFNDYRINPENGNLPQRVGGLALALSDVTFPARDSDAWRSSNEWRIGYDWFYRIGNDADRMLLVGRATCGLLAVALGVLVWHSSRRIFGPLGGLVSLLLFVLSPTILANGALITSDMACSLFFFAATLTIWRTLHRVTPMTLLASALTVGALFVSKMSALLIVPIAATLAIVRLCRGEALPIGFGRGWLVSKRWQQAAVFGALGLVHAVAAFTVVWAAYGFRYSAFQTESSREARFPYTWEYLAEKPGPTALLKNLQLTRDQNLEVARILTDRRVFTNQWSYDALTALREARERVLTAPQRESFDRFMDAPATAVPARILEVVRRKHWLPEAYVYGYLHAWSFSRIRGAFMNGHYSLSGWPSFFPYTFAVKTPLPVFGILVLAIVAFVWGGKRMPAYAAGPAISPRSVGYETIPLWILWISYWAALLPSHLNIGHRHMMVTYAPLFVLGGAVGMLMHGTTVALGWPRLRLLVRFAVPALLALLAAEMVYRFPNYLAYFNVVAGGPEHGYRRLVDSSLDWGQDLRAAKARLDSDAYPAPVYLSYFGNGSPKYYGVRAQLWHGNPGWDEVDEPAFKKIDVPAATAGSDLQTFLAAHPDYDSNLVGRIVDGEVVHAMLVKKASALRLGGGTYLISATLLQTVLSSVDACFGPWNRRLEDTYQELARTVKPLLDDSADMRRAALGAHDPDSWQALWQRYDEFRFSRLAAFLRQREPADNINGSILVFRLSEADVSRALGGPPPELGPDLPR